MAAPKHACMFSHSATSTPALQSSRSAFLRYYLQLIQHQAVAFASHRIPSLSKLRGSHTDTHAFVIDQPQNHGSITKATTQRRRTPRDVFSQLLPSPFQPSGVPRPPEQHQLAQSRAAPRLAHTMLSLLAPRGSHRAHVGTLWRRYLHCHPLQWLTHSSTKIGRRAN